jgi:hypothetical protein
LIEQYIKPELIRRDKTFIVLTPTNISALLVNGETLDRFTAKIKSKESLEKYQTDYFIIDEVSMMKEINYKLLSIIQKYCPDSKFIISGDFEQHAPVKDRVGNQSQSYYENSNVLHELCNGNRLLLETCRRSDDKLHKLCKDVKRLTGKEFGNKYTNHHICFTNEKRKELNNYMMDHVTSSRKKSKKMRDPLILDKLSYDKNSQDVELHSKMPIISSKNKPVIKVDGKNVKLEILNNEMFTIDKILDNDTIVIKNSRINFELPSSSFQRCFYVAFAITSHKAQGQTYDHPYTISEWGRMDNRCKKVALTRATKYEHVNIF